MCPAGLLEGFLTSDASSRGCCQWQGHLWHVFLLRLSSKHHFSVIRSVPEGEQWRAEERQEASSFFPPSELTRIHHQSIHGNIEHIKLDIEKYNSLLNIHSGWNVEPHADKNNEPPNIVSEVDSQDYYFLFLHLFLLSCCFSASLTQQAPPNKTSSVILVLKMQSESGEITVDYNKPEDDDI